MPVPRSSRGRRRGTRAGARAQALGRGLVLFVFFLLAAGGVGAFLIWAGQENVRLGADLCPDDPAFRPPKIIVVLFDQTDQLTQAHQKALQSNFREFLDREFVSQEAQSKWRFSRIEFYSFRSKAKSSELDLRLVLALCNPGGVDGLTKFHSNPDQVRRTFEQRFLARVDQELRALLEFKESPRSPVFDAVKSIGLDVFTNPRYKQSEKLLVVASDLLHNTDELKMHAVQPKFADFYKSAYGNRMIAELRGARVQLWVFEMATAVAAQRALANFWGLYFERSNGRPESYGWIR